MPWLLLALLVTTALFPPASVAAAGAPLALRYLYVFTEAGGRNTGWAWQG